MYPMELFLYIVLDNVPMNFVSLSFEKFGGWARSAIQEVESMPLLHPLFTQRYWDRAHHRAGGELSEGWREILGKEISSWSSCLCMCTLKIDLVGKCSPDGRYNFQPYSSVVLEARPVTQWHDPTGSAWFIWQNLLQLVITVSVTASKPTNLQKDHLQLEATRSIVHGRNLKGLQRKASAKRWEPGTTTKCSRC